MRAASAWEIHSWAESFSKLLDIDKVLALDSNFDTTRLQLSLFGCGKKNGRVRTAASPNCALFEG
jgi:hypothetical protein